MISHVIIADLAVSNSKEYDDSQTEVCYFLLQQCFAYIDFYFNIIYHCPLMKEVLGNFFKGEQWHFVIVLMFLWEDLYSYLHISCSCG